MTDRTGVSFMAEQKQSSQQWLPTYRLVTVERILGHYNMRLSEKDMIVALNKPETFFYKLLKLPLINVMTGLIRQQAYDLQVYAQKLYVDYLLSGETVKPESSPGGLTREELETNRLELVASSKSFHELEYTHNKQIASCQRLVVNALKSWRKALDKAKKNIQALAKKHGIQWTTDQVEALLLSLFANLPIDTIDEDPKQVLPYLESSDSKDMERIVSAFCEHLKPLKAEAKTLIQETQALEEEACSLRQQMRQFRKTFEENIVTTNELLRVLPDYLMDQDQDEMNREAIQLDTQVTETDTE